MRNILTLKGRKDGMILSTSQDCSFEEFFYKFKIMVSKQKNFFDGCKIIGIEGIDLTKKQRDLFKAFIDTNRHVELISFDYKETEENNPKERLNTERLKSANFRNLTPEKKIDKIQRNLKINLEKNQNYSKESLYYKGTVRAGIKLESEKNITVVGDVNAGAELIAKGDIIVLGKLRGFAFAGSDGTIDKTISAWKLNPTQIRIGDYITIPPEGSLDEVDYPETAFIKDGRLIIKSYV